MESRSDKSILSRKGDKSAMRPFARLLWILVIFIGQHCCLYLLLSTDRFSGPAGASSLLCVCVSTARNIMGRQGICPTNSQIGRGLPFILPYHCNLWYGIESCSYCI